MFPVHPESSVRGVCAWLALIGLVVLALAPAQARAAYAPIDPVQLHGSAGVSGVVTGMSPTGEGVMVFRNGANQLPFSLGAVSRSTAGSFSGVQPLSSTPDVSPPSRITFSGSGGAFVPWGIAAIPPATSPPGQFAERPAGGTFSTGVFGAGSSSPDCGRFVDAQFGPDGSLLLACSSTVAPMMLDPYSVVIATRPAGSQGFGTASAPFPNIDNDGQDPVVAAGADGTRAVAVKQQATTAANPTVQVWVDPAGAAGPSVTPFALSALGELSDLAVLSDGTVIVLYADVGGVTARVRPTGDATAFGAAQVVDSQAVDAAVEPDGPGGALLMLRRDDVISGSVTTLVASRPPGGPFSPPALLETAADVHPSDLEVAASGLAVITRTPAEGTTGELAAWIRPSAGAAFTGPHVVTPTAVSGSLGISPTGDILAGWSTAPGAGDERLFAGGLDAGSKPALTDVQAPATALVGQPISFSAAASDWSGIREVRWVFADGDTATGERVSHAYARAGTYQVLARAVDRAGNVSDRDLSVRVVAPSVSPPPEPDRTAPTLTAKTKSKLTRSQLLRGVKVTVSSNEPATIVADLRRAGAKPNSRALGTRTVRGVTKAVTITVKPRKTLLGKRRALSLQLRLTATDATGNKRVVTKKISVSR